MGHGSLMAVNVVNLWRVCHEGLYTEILGLKQAPWVQQVREVRVSARLETTARACAGVRCADAVRLYFVARATALCRVASSGVGSNRTAALGR
eukprot:XP_001692720.1 predicted protein [Chlamydomonas reinhardtii]